MAIIMMIISLFKKLIFYEFINGMYNRRKCKQVIEQPEYVLFILLPRGGSVKKLNLRL